MENDQEKIIEALNLIKEICVHHNCENCPFGTDKSSCVIQEYSPDSWPVVHKASTIWRAFQQ